MCRDLVDRSIERIKKTLEEVKLSKTDIEEIVLVGGTTLIPAIREAVKNYFGKEPNKSINPEEVVALGASIEAEILRAQKEGRAPEGDIKSVLLLDVLPLSLGIETLGGVDTIMIQKNTTIPTAKTQTFSTAADNQPSVEVNVLQGERPMAQDNRSISRFILDGIPPAPRGLPQVEVTFDIDASGILTVTAKDKATNKVQSVKVEGSIGLSKDEVEKMKKEAELHAEEDKKKRELIEVKNMADTLVYTSEKALKEAGDKVSADSKKEIEEKLEALKKVKDSDNIDDIKKKTEDLSQAIQKIGAEMYKQTSGQQPPQGEGQQPPQSEEQKPEEGEFKEKQ
jgi:molecular chaperone DnaK